MGEYLVRTKQMMLMGLVRWMRWVLLFAGVSTGW